MDSIGENLRRIRIENGWNQSQVANIFHIQRQTWASYERGKSFPDAKLLVDLSKKINRSVDDILGIEPITNSNVDFGKIQNSLKENISNCKWLRIKYLPSNKPKNNMINIFNQNYNVEFHNPLSLLKGSERIYIEFLNCYSDDVETRISNYYNFVKKYGILGLNLEQSKTKYFVNNYLTIYNNEYNQDFNFWQEIYKGSMTSIIIPYEETVPELNRDISKWLSNYNSTAPYFEDLNNYVIYNKEILELLYKKDSFVINDDITIICSSNGEKIKTTYSYGSLLGLMKLEILFDVQYGAYTKKCYNCGKYFLTDDKSENFCNNSTCKERIYPF